MKGFKDSSRMRSGFNFGQNSGFTASSGKVQNISYTRKTPHRKPVAKFADGGPVVRPDRPRVRGSSVAGKGALQALRESVAPRKGLRWQGVDEQVERMAKAEGGKIDNTLHSFKDDSQLNSEYGPKGGLRPFFARGGYAGKYADGGKVKTYPGGGRPQRQNRSVRASFANTAATESSPPSESKAAMKARAIGAQDRILNTRFAKGGRAAHSDAAQDRPMMAKAAKEAVSKHVAAPAPKGHKGLKSC